VTASPNSKSKKVKKEGMKMDSSGSREGHVGCPEHSIYFLDQWRRRTLFHIARKQKVPVT
jgi:hypothetical protein